MADIDEIVKSVVKEQVAERVGKDEKTMYKKIKEQVLEELNSFRPIVIQKGKKKIYPDKAVRHEATEQVIQYISAGIPLLLVGPAGSGKTHLVVECAKMLDLPYYSMSVNEQSSKSDFLGYMDANGKIVKTNFRKAYELGGVFIIDEIDAGNPNILTVVNSALSNDLCPFPDMMVKRHEDFIAVCTANTFGDGESMQYIGRNILDLATRDRFATIFVDYSLAIESLTLPRYLGMVRELREYFLKNNKNLIVSTRAGIRLESLTSISDGIPDIDAAVNCLNLHQESAKDPQIKRIVQNHLQNLTGLEKAKASKVATFVTEAIPF